MPFFHFKTCHNDANMLYFSHRKQGVFAMAGYRRERVNEEVGRIVNETIMTIKDPRVSPHIITITHCDVSGDLKFAKIYFSVLNATHEEIKEVKTGLYSAAGYIRKRLAEILNMRSTPELHFEYDDLVEKGDRVFELLKQEEDKRKQKEQGNGQ